MIVRINDEQNIDSDIVMISTDKIVVSISVSDTGELIILKRSIGKYENINIQPIAANSISIT